MAIDTGCRLHELVAAHFAQPPAPGAAPAEQVRTVEKDHGRIEVRRCWASDDPALLAWLDPERPWPGLRSVAAVEAERRLGETVTHET
ncbi:MAG: ISAs1 family transposase, partial [Chloroflexia bacterium]|nr:ISAs1 family transposase [Chloroflexia bacterium]